MTSQRTIILASASPTRKRLMEENIRLPFTVDPSNFEEDLTRDLPPDKLVQELALGKARDVASRHEDAIVIGSDTVAHFEGHVMGKPQDIEDARSTLRRLSGTVHQLYTGLALIDSSTTSTSSGQVDKTITDSSKTDVYFRELSDEDINAYADSGEPLNKAGSYEYLSRGWFLIDHIDGDPYTIAGLPLLLLAQHLRAFGISIFSETS